MKATEIARKAALVTATATMFLCATNLWAAGNLDLVSAGVSDAPDSGDAAVWSKAADTQFELAGAGKFEGKKLNISVKSVHTDDMVFFRLSWADSEKSMSKKAWVFKDGAWTMVKADEDRLGMVFEINRISKFATKGCAVLCHNQSKNEKDWYYAVNSKKEKGDLWHWKSVRSNPAGFTEDTYVTTNPSEKPEKGRKRDAGNGKAKSNKTKDKTGPAYMQDPAKPASVPGSLLTTEAVKIANFEGFKNGDTIPGYMVNPDWTDSFADLKTQGVWKDGRWTVFISRKMDTGNDDDLAFNPRKKYPFAIAVFNNSHEHHSYNSDPLKLSFK